MCHFHIKLLALRALDDQEGESLHLYTCVSAACMYSKHERAAKHEHTHTTRVSINLLQHFLFFLLLQL